MERPTGPAIYARLARLPLEIDGYALEGLAVPVASDFVRRTTLVRLTGGGHEGVGEEVNYDGADQEAFQQAGAVLPLSGSHDLDGFSRRLDELDLFGAKAPSLPFYRNYRRWAYESAALDLALRQAGCSLADRLGIEPTPLRFVVSMGLGQPPTTDRLDRWLRIDPTLRFKLDANPQWDDALVGRLAALDAIDVVDFKGAYKGTPVDQAPNAALYARVACGLPQALLEDPSLTPATLAALDDHRDRITWDAPIHSVDDIRSLAFAPRVVNFKPSRFGSVRALCEGYDYCRQEGIGMYGGGQFELGPGRDQIQLLASLFHPVGPNDVAPTGYNEASPSVELPGSPLAPSPAPTGFRRAAD